MRGNSDGFVKNITVEENVKTLEKAKITVRKIPYLGKDLTVTDILAVSKGNLTVKVNGKSLIYDKDFTVEFADDNTKAGSRTSAGTYPVVIMGQGEYAGSRMANIVVTGIDYDVVVTNDIKCGTAKVAITGKGNYTGREIELSEDDFMKAELSKLGKTLKLGEDFEIVERSYVKNVDVGSAQVVIKGIGNFDGYKLITFRIVKKDLKWWQKNVQ